MRHNDVLGPGGQQLGRLGYQYNIHMRKRTWRFIYAEGFPRLDIACVDYTSYWYVRTWEGQRTAT